MGCKSLKKRFENLEPKFEMKVEAIFIEPGMSQEEIDKLRYEAETRSPGCLLLQVNFVESTTKRAVGFMEDKEEENYMV